MGTSPHFFSVSGILKAAINIDIARMIELIKIGRKNGNLPNIESITNKN